MKPLIAKCGGDCVRCLGYKANARTHETRQRTSDGWDKYLSVRLKPDSIICDGCLAPNPWASGNLLPDRCCIIRPCAVKTGVENCAFCAAYPCGACPPDMDREKIAAKLGQPIPEEDYLTFIKPYERLKNLDRIRASLKPEDLKAPFKPKPIKARILPFPDDLPIEQDEANALRAVHALVASIMTAGAETYAHQLRRKRSRPQMMALLWLIALRGDLQEGDGAQIVLDGRVHGARKDCGWLVRKRDNALHSAIRHSTKHLKGYGAQAEFTSLKDGWQLKLSFTKAAGGAAALKALKRWVEALAAAHGQPVYAGASKLKGEAFERFKRADM